MKKVFSLILSLAVAFVGFTSCDDDDDDPISAEVAGTYTGTASVNLGYPVGSTSLSLSTTAYTDEDYTVKLREYNDSYVKVSCLSIDWTQFGLSEAISSGINSIISLFNYIEVPISKSGTTYTLGSADIELSYGSYSITGTFAGGEVEDGVLSFEIEDLTLSGIDALETISDVEISISYTDGQE